MAEHAELIELLRVVDRKVDTLASKVEALRNAYDSKVDQDYCLKRCQPRWVPRSYLAVSGTVGGFIVLAVALLGDILNLAKNIGIGK